MINEGRNFAFILYPDSMPDCSIDLLLNEQFCVAISPLHCADDENKKSHYHVLISFSGKQNMDTINAEMKAKYNCTNLVKVKDRNKYTRYMLHLDNPEKEQFENDNIIANYDLRTFLTKEVLVIDILNDIKEKRIRNFQELVDTYRSLGKYNELEKIASKGTFFKAYFNTEK